MTQNEPDGSSVDAVMRLLDSLTPEQKEALRRKLNEKAWGRSFEELFAQTALSSPNNFGKKVAQALQQFVDRLSSGDIDEDIKQASRVVWQGIQQTIRSSTETATSKLENPVSELERALLETQNDLIEIKQAVAQAIASEKLLEQQVHKYAEQAITWLNRSDMAVQQGNQDLANQALERKAVYDEKARTFGEQWQNQKTAVMHLREKLSKTEAEVQKLFTQKELLLARAKIADSTAKAHEILSRTTNSSALSVLERMEKKVAQKEAEALAFQEISGAQTPDKLDIDQTLIKAVDSIERLTGLCEAMEARILEIEARQKRQGAS